MQYWFNDLSSCQQRSQRKEELSSCFRKREQTFFLSWVINRGLNMQLYTGVSGLNSKLISLNRNVTQNKVAVLHWRLFQRTASVISLSIRPVWPAASAWNFPWSPGRPTARWRTGRTRTGCATSWRASGCVWRASPPPWGTTAAAAKETARTQTSMELGTSCWWRCLIVVCVLFTDQTKNTTWIDIQKIHIYI